MGWIENLKNHLLWKNKFRNRLRLTTTFYQYPQLPNLFYFLPYRQIFQRFSHFSNTNHCKKFSLAFFLLEWKKKRTHFAPLFVIVHVSSTRYTPIKNLMSIFLSFLYFLSLSNSHSILFIFHSRHTSATHAHIRKQKEKNFYFSFPFFFFFASIFRSSFPARGHIISYILWRVGIQPTFSD